MFDKDITIVNKFYNKETKQNEYKLHTLRGFWSSNEGIKISNTNLIKNDGLKAIILFSESGYLSPIDYLGEEGTWTLKNDDYLVKGILEKVTSLADLKRDYECMKITNVSKKDYGSFEMQHFEIIGE